ncbi:hypothetical protein OH690_05300 [Escherichia coli]|nr:hypothetical protein [Escherichia coli]
MTGLETPEGERWEYKYDPFWQAHQQAQQPAATNAAWIFTGTATS